MVAKWAFLCPTRSRGSVSRRDEWGMGTGAQSLHKTLNLSREEAQNSAL